MNPRITCIGAACLPTGSFLSFVLAGPAHAGATNLVADGGFESPATPKTGLVEYQTGSALGAWTVVGASGDVQTLGKSFTFENHTFKPKKGAAQVDLTGESQTATGVAQTIPTAAGENYTLTFYVGNEVNGSNLGPTATVDVSVDGSQVLAAVNSGGAGTTSVSWKKFTLKLTASGTSTTLSFLNGDASSNTYAGLDAVSLTAS